MISIAVFDLSVLLRYITYSAWDEVFVDNMGLPEPVATLQRPFVRLYTSLKYGPDTRHITPHTQIQKLGDRPALLIHSTADSQVPFANFERLTAVAPAHVESWVREGDLHFIVQPGSFLNPEEDVEYAGRILQFLAQHFGGWRTWTQASITCVSTLALRDSLAAANGRI